MLIGVLDRNLVCEGAGALDLRGAGGLHELSPITSLGNLGIHKPEGPVADLLKLKIRPMGVASAEADLYEDRGRR
jgi:hypothetical protein